jgi:uncharacterized LabA/DUF88 family protein
MKVAQNNYAFIDSQNLNLGVRSQGWILDFARFRIFLKDKYNVKKAFLCIGYVNNNQLLYTFLQKSGYICVFKPTLEIKENGTIKIKGNVDAELVLHTMIERDNCDKAVIISGDGDFHCLIEYLEESGKLRKIIVPNQRYSSLLRKFSDHIVNIQLFKGKLGFKNRLKEGG